MVVVFHHFLKWSLLISFWRRYRAALKQLPILVIAVLLIYNIHADYVAYVEVSDDHRFLAGSFVVKWALIAFLVLGYWLYARHLLSHKNKAQPKSMDRKKGDNALNSTDSDTPDPFEKIRNKSTLLSRSEYLINKKNREKS